jgi:small GTP-binding protein
MEKSLLDDYESVFKLLIIGNSGVGKSNMLLRFTRNKFDDTYDITIGVDFGVKNVICDDTIYKLQIWDTAGQETFKSMTQTFYRGADGCIIVYDITNKESFNNVPSWLSSVRRLVPDIVVILVGNKIDMDYKREVTTNEGKDFAEKNNIQFFETSTKTAENINECFMYSVEKIKENKANKIINKNEQNNIPNTAICSCTLQ